MSDEFVRLESLTYSVTISVLGLICGMIMAWAAGVGFSPSCLTFLAPRPFEVRAFCWEQTALTPHEETGIVPSASWLIPFD